MNILLVKAAGLTIRNPLVTYPLGIMYLSAFLKKAHNDYNIRLIDLRVTKNAHNKLKDVIGEFNPDVVGISAITMEADSMHEIARMSKEVDTRIKVVAGGPHPTSFTKDTLQDTNIDYAVLGEGELTFDELVSVLRGEGDITGVKGIALRKNGQLHRTEPREHIVDLDSLPYPAWDMIDIDRYHHFKTMSLLGRRRYMNLFTSRACPYHCIYCHNIFGKGFRARSPENVIDEIDILYNKYEIKEFEILDDIFNIDNIRVERICDLIIERGYKIRIAFPNGLRSDRLEKRTLEKMYAAGVVFISFAVETASPRLQRLIRKNLKLDRVREVIEYAVKLGIFSNGFFMLGFPTETEEEMQETVRFALKSNLHTTFFSLSPPLRAQNCMKNIRIK